MLRTGRRSLLALLGLAGLVAACTPQPPPPPPPPPPAEAAVLCPTSVPPGPADQAALVDPDNGPPQVVTFEATTPAEVQQKVAELDQTATVVAVAPDQAVSALVDPNDDPYYPAAGLSPPGQWGFVAGMMDFPTAWNTNSVDGNGVKVAVVDTGVQANHADLGANVLPGKDYITPSNDGRVDGNGHGTHVAGTIAAIDNIIGVVGGAPAAKILPVRVLDCQGTGSFSDVANGILWASDPTLGNANVINLSLGGFGTNSVLQSAVQTAVNRGVTVVAAAGNCGNGGGSCPSPNASIIPGSYSQVVSVGSIDQGGTKSSFSNNNAYVAIAAPGSTVVSTFNDGGYRVLSGTSMATPHISALAALIFQKCPASTKGATWPTFVRNQITSTASGAALAGFVNPVKLANAGAATTNAIVCPA